MNPIKIEINGETHTFEEWAKIAGVSPVLLYNRVSCGKRGTDIIAPQKRFYKEEIEINGVLHTMREWSEITGIKYNTLLERYKHGATAEEFLKPTRKWERRK